MPCKQKKYNAGTDRVKGHGTRISDSISAKLSKDEAVLNAGAADMLGRGTIARLNKMHAPKGAKTSIKHGVMKAAAGIDDIDKRLAEMAAQRAASNPSASTPGYTVKAPQSINIQTPEQMARASAAGVGKARPAVTPAVERISSDVLARRAAPGIASRVAGAAGKLLNNPLTMGASLLSYSGEVGAGSDIPGGGMPVNPGRMVNQEPTGIGAVPNQALQPTISELSRRQAQATTMPTAQQPAVASPQAQTDADSQAWLSARGVKPGMTNIGEGGNMIYKTAPNAFVGVGPGGPSEAARQAAFAQEQASNTRNSISGMAQRGDMNAAKQLTAMDESAQNLAAGQQTMADARRTASIRDKYLETLPLEQQAQAIGIGAKQQNSYTLANRKTKTMDGDQTEEPYGAFDERTGKLTPFEQVQGGPEDQAVNDAKRAIATGKITKEEANKRLVAAGMKPIP